MPTNNNFNRAPLPPKGSDGVDENLIFGRNPVAELLKSRRDVDKIYMIDASENTDRGSLPLIAALAAERKIPVTLCDRRKLDGLLASNGVGSGVHQGVVALAAARNYASVEDILRVAELRGERPFVVICDEIEDPHNLGAIIRSADAAGAHGVIVPKRRSAPLSSTCAKASAGAIEHMAITKVTNIAATVDLLKEKGLWIYGADMGGSPYHKTDMTGAAAIILGGEGFGISPLVKKKCDFIVSIEMFGKINSLNVSCAAAVILCEAARQRARG